MTSESSLSNAKQLNATQKYYAEENKQSLTNIMNSIENAELMGTSSLTTLYHQGDQLDSINNDLNDIEKVTSESKITLSNMKTGCLPSFKQIFSRKKKQNKSAVNSGSNNMNEHKILQNVRIAPSVIMPKLQEQMHDQTFLPTLIPLIQTEITYQIVKTNFDDQVNNENKQLELISRGLDKLKFIGDEINTELEIHGRKISELDTKMSNSINALDGTNKTIMRML